jgi:hypothetical protein
MICFLDLNNVSKLSRLIARSVIKSGKSCYEPVKRGFGAGKGIGRRIRDEGIGMKDKG